MPGQAVLVKTGWGLEPYLRRTFYRSRLTTRPGRYTCCQAWRLLALTSGLDRLQDALQWDRHPARPVVELVAQFVHRLLHQEDIQQQCDLLR